MFCIYAGQYKGHQSQVTIKALKMWLMQMMK